MDGKFDIFEVKTSLKGCFKLSERQATGRGFAETVLTDDVPTKGGYFKVNPNTRMRVAISNREAQRIYDNIGDTKKIFITATFNKKHRFIVDTISKSSW